MGKKRSFQTNTKLRTGALALLAVVAVGISYTAASGDLAYSAKSMLAAVTSAVDTTPRIVITRSTYSPAGTVWPTRWTEVGLFDVSPKYITSYGYLRQVNTSIVVDPTTAGLKLGEFKMWYSYCVSPLDCRGLNVPVSSVVASTTKIGRTRYFISSVGSLNLPVYVGQSTGKLAVSAYPYYQSYYNAVGAPTASIKADVDSASGAGRQCSYSATDGSAICKYPSVNVGTSLAYGNWLKVARGVGYGYGYYDYTQNGQLNKLDADYLVKVAVGTLGCPIFKICNVDGKYSNTTGKAVDVSDVALLNKYIGGPVTPPPSSAPTPSVSFVSASAVTNPDDGANNDRGTFTIKYKVTAVGGIIYTPDHATIGSPLATGETALRIEKSGVAVANGTTVAITTNPGLVPTPNGNYKIAAGQTVEFTLTTAVQLPVTGTAGLYRALLAGIGWGLTDTTVTKSANTDLGVYKTDYLSLN